MASERLSPALNVPCISSSLLKNPSISEIDCCSISKSCLYKGPTVAAASAFFFSVATVSTSSFNATYLCVATEPICTLSIVCI